MVLSVNALSNYQIWGNTEEVFLYSVTRGGATGTALVTGNPCEIDTAKRRAPTYKELSASNGAYTGQDLVWLLPAALMNGAPNAPKPGDRIKDAAGNTWTVLEAALNALKSTWRLMTRNLALAHQLYDLIDIQRSAVTYDAAGGALRGWPDDPSPTGTVVYASLPAKVQLLTQATSEVLGVFGLKGTYAVFVGQDVVIQKMDRIAWKPTGGAATYLDILGQHNPQRIDELPILDCILQP